MAYYYQATITYPGDYVAHVVHKGEKPHHKVVKMLAKYGATIAIGEPVPVDKAKEYEDMERGIRAYQRFSWHPALEIPEGDDDGDD